MLIDINALDSIGQINDVKPYQLPPEAFTVLLNVRFNEQGLAVTPGWQETMIPSGGTRMWAPHFILPIKTSSQTYWIYTSLAKAAVFDGLSDFDLTRSVGGDYTATDTHEWNGCTLSGVPILNNGSDVPQFWSNVGNTSTRLSNLTNWPATMRAKIIRSLGPFLIALNIVDSGVEYPHLIQWSHPANPGAVPSSWAYNDPTKDGGRVDLADVNSGPIVEALALQDTLFIYKERSIWKLRFVGGRAIMSVGAGPWVENIGIIGPRCVAQVGDGLRHCVATREDIMVHNGNQINSVLLDRQRQTLFANMNLETAHRSFMFSHPTRPEIWFCYPETGQDYPNMALIWNYGKGIGAISYVDGITFRNVARGDVEGADPETWDDGTDLWDDDNGPWAELFREQLIAADPTASKLFQLDRLTTKNGNAYTPTILREDLAVLGRDRSGKWIVDIGQMKMINSVWPKADGSPMRFRVGYKQKVEGDITWQPYVTFTPGTDDVIYPFIDESLAGSGRLFSYEFSGTSGLQWSLFGFKMDVIPVGTFNGV